MSSMEEIRECGLCGKAYDDTDFVDVFTSPNGISYCEHCLPNNKEGN